MGIEQALIQDLFEIEKLPTLPGLVESKYIGFSEAMGVTANLNSKIPLRLKRLVSGILLMGQVVIHLLRGQIDLSSTLEKMQSVGFGSLAIALTISASVEMVFAIQVGKYFQDFSATHIIGGVLAVTLTRELSPVLTAVVVAGRVGSAFAAEIGTMKVTQQIDALYVLKTDPVDYLVTPRVLACCLMLPTITVISIVAGIISGLIVAQNFYGVSPITFLNSVQDFLQVWDLIAAQIKSVIFGIIIATIGCNWGMTVTGGAKGVGESTASAVVTALTAIIVTNFFLSWLMFQGSVSNPLI